MDDTADQWQHQNPPSTLFYLPLPFIRNPLPPQRNHTANFQNVRVKTYLNKVFLGKNRHKESQFPHKRLFSAIGAIDAIRNTKQLAVMCPTPPRPDLLAVIVSTEPPRCHCRTSPPT
jgi:hypothetical protein